MTIATTFPDILWHRVHDTGTAETKKRDAEGVDDEWKSHHNYNTNKRQRRILTNHNHNHNHAHYGENNSHLSFQHKSRHERLVEAMWMEARDYWLVLPEDEMLDEDTAKRLLRGLQLESVQVQTLPLPLQQNTQYQKVKAAECLQLTFTLPIHNNNYYNNQNRKSYDWRVSWYDIANPYTVAAAGSITMEPFVQGGMMDGQHRSAHHHHHHPVQEVQVGGWALQPMDHWKDECHKWLQGANCSSSVVCAETVARLVMAGVGILARDALATRNSSNKPLNINNNNNNINNNSLRNTQKGWIFKRTMLRLERELVTWRSNYDNNNTVNIAKKDPNEMEVSESLQRKGGLLSHPTVVEALRRERRWEQPIY